MLFFYLIVRCCILPEFSTCEQRINATERKGWHARKQGKCKR